MNTGTLPESTVAKKRISKRNDGVSQPQEPLTGDRVEFQAPADWVQRVDKAAAALGMSRSAYIRMAVNNQMNADRRANEGG